MIDQLALDLVTRGVKTKELSFWVSFDPASLEELPSYDGPVSLDYYGRLHPGHVVGSVRLRTHTSSTREILDALLYAFDKKVDHRLLIRRIGVNADKTASDDGIYQLDLFTDYEALKREKAIQGAMLEIRQRYGKNAVVKGLNMLEGATTMERNMQIGGHKSGKTGALEPSEL
jgi:DNA polymerase V